MHNEYRITKEEHLYTSDEKLKWMGYGEWVEEADLIEFEYSGYEAAVRRVFIKELYAREEAYFGGHLCGYVKIPKDHPYYKKGYDDIQIDAHGGLTFSEWDSSAHWIGFDCAHSGDYVPTSEHMKKTHPDLIRIQKMFPPPEGYENLALFNPFYRNVEYCIKTCMEMIDQLIEINTVKIKKENK